MEEKIPIQTRLEKKIDVLSNKIDSVQIKLVELEVINKSHDDRSIKNTQEIELLKMQFNRADGVIQFFKWFSGIAIINVIAFALWVSSNINNMKPMERDLSDVRIRLEEQDKRIQHLEKRP